MKYEKWKKKKNLPSRVVQIVAKSGSVYEFNRENSITFVWEFCIKSINKNIIVLVNIVWIKRGWILL